MGPEGGAASAASDLFLQASVFSFIRERAAFCPENIHLASVKTFPQSASLTVLPRI